MLKSGIDYIGQNLSFFCTDGSGRWLMRKRSEKCRDEHHTWAFGSGEQDWGEEVVDGVLREIKEEYGCEGRILDQFPCVSIIREENGIVSHWSSSAFIVQVNPDEVDFTVEADKFEDSGWFHSDELPENMHSGARQLIEKQEFWFEPYGLKL